MKKSPFFITSCILILSILPTVISHYILSQNELKARKQADIVLAQQIHDKLLSCLNEPMIVARTLGRDAFLINALKTENEKSEQEVVAQMKEYLSHIKSEFSYSTVTLLSHSTHRYFNEYGLLKVANPQKDPGDVWIVPYEKNEMHSSIGVYRDPNDLNDSRFFFNRCIEDENGTFLGIVSTGLYIRELQEIIKPLEEKYNVIINLTDETGLVTLASTISEIEIASLSHIVKPQMEQEGEWKYLHHGIVGFIVAKYLEDFNWYFVTRSNKSPQRFFTESIFYITALIFLILGLYALYFYNRKKATPQRGTVRSNSQTDALTGLPNRNFFKQMYGERGVFNTTRYRTLAVFDIDFFKEANDNMNGDIILSSVILEANRLLQERGMILRWGGDEFLMLLELNMESAYAVCRQFCKNVEASTSVTVSVGLVEVRLSDTIKKNYYRAAQNCYQVKEMGGNGVIKG